MWEPYFAVQRKIAHHRQIPIFDVAEILQAFSLSPDQAFLDEMHPTGKTNIGWHKASPIKSSIKGGRKHPLFQI